MEIDFHWLFSKKKDSFVHGLAPHLKVKAKQISKGALAVVFFFDLQTSIRFEPLVVYLTRNSLIVRPTEVPNELELGIFKVPSTMIRFSGWRSVSRARNEMVTPSNLLRVKLFKLSNYCMTSFWVLLSCLVAAIIPFGVENLGKYVFVEKKLECLTPLDILYDPTPPYQSGATLHPHTFHLTLSLFPFLSKSVEIVPFSEFLLFLFYWPDILRWFCIKVVLWGEWLPPSPPKSVSLIWSFFWVVLLLLLLLLLLLFLLSHYVFKKTKFGRKYHSVSDRDNNSHCPICGTVRLGVKSFE